MLGVVHQFVFERPAARQHFVQDRPDAVDIGGRRELCVRTLLWGHIRIRPDTLPGSMSGLQAVGHVEIHEDWDPSPEDDIRGFQIPMDIPTFMEMDQRGTHMNDGLYRVWNRYLTSWRGIDQVEQRRSM